MGRGGKVQCVRGKKHGMTNQNSLLQKIINRRDYGGKRRFLFNPLLGNSNKGQCQKRKEKKACPGPGEFTRGGTLIWRLKKHTPPIARATP